MPKINSDNFGDINKSSFSINEIVKYSDDIVKNCLSETIKNCKDGASVVLELPTETYSNVNVSSAKFLIDSGYEGIYVSFQRPFKNILSIFKNQGIDTNKMAFIDLATQCSIDEDESSYECTDLSRSLNVEQLGKSVYSQIDKFKSNKIFILIDSLNTLSLYKSSKDIVRFADILVENINSHGSKNVVVLFSLAKDLCKKDFARHITYNADQVINVEKYDHDVIHPNLLT